MMTLYSASAGIDLASLSGCDWLSVCKPSKNSCWQRIILPDTKWKKYAIYAKLATTVMLRFSRRQKYYQGYIYSRNVDCVA